MISDLVDDDEVGESCLGGKVVSVGRRFKSGERPKDQAFVIEN